MQLQFVRRSVCSLWGAHFFCSGKKRTESACTRNLKSSIGFAFGFVAFLLGLVNSAFDSEAGAQSADVNATTSITFNASMGLGGVWKVGYPTQVILDIMSGSGLSGSVQIQTCDGDGVNVVYTDPSWVFKLQSGKPEQLRVFVKNGRSNRPIVVRVLGNAGELILERALNEKERGQVLPATQPWVVGIGSALLQLDQGFMKSARGALSEFSTVVLTRGEDLPTAWQGYEGVDLVAMSSSNEALNQSITSTQANALRSWLARGGRLILSLGSQSASWVDKPDFASILPGTFDGVMERCDSAPLESFLGSQSPLDKLTCAVCTLRTGTVDVVTQTPDRLKFPLVAKWACGAGKVSFVGTEIDSPEILKWESRPALLKSLLADQWEKKTVQREKLSYQGYDDLSGQLNATLDNFPQLTLGNLTSISILVGVLCLIIGPLDFFVVSKAWKRPRGTWITLLVCSMGSCMIAIGMTRSWKPAEPSMNSLELIDIDYQSQTVTGRGYSHFYGGVRGTFDFAASRRKKLNALEKSITNSDVALDWFGQPGRGLGGFESTVATDRGMPMYQIRGATQDQLDRAENQDLQNGLFGIGIPAAGTKSFCASWSESIAIPATAHSLSVVPGSIDLLEGSYANPLDIDLMNSLLIYRGRAYFNNTRLQSGETVTINSSTLPKDVVRRLQRRQNVGGEERSSPWNSGGNDNLDRLFEMIAFHQASGGSNYTGLYNRFLSTLDASEVIRYDRAVLLAEVDEAALVWSIHRDSIPVQPIEGTRKTFIRLFIPVARSTKPAPSTFQINPK